MKRILWPVLIACWLAVGVFLGCIASGEREEVQTRVYLVDEVFWRILAGHKVTDMNYRWNDADESKELLRFLTFFGATFGPHASIDVCRSRSTVTIRNTTEELDRIEKLMAPADGGGTFYEKRLR